MAVVPVPKNRMKLNIREEGELLFAHKPSGISTHSQDGKSLAFVEYLSEELGKTLKVCHRLDKETSGAIIFALSSFSAQELYKAFENQQIKKQYLFISDRPFKQKYFQHSSQIEKRGNSFVSDFHKDAAANSTTTFTLLETYKSFSLWEALPVTGKPHQIRLHASDRGINILGDTVHRGTRFPAMLLHAKSVSCDTASLKFFHEAEAAHYFHNLSLLDDQMLVDWIAQASRRTALFSFAEADALRLLKTCDKLGAVSCFRLNQEEFPAKERVEKFCSLFGLNSYVIIPLSDRGSSAPDAPVLSKNCPESWVIKENDFSFEARSQQGFSPGLFLDQRKNRQWVKKHSSEKRVLNLFSYTGGFSVAAALGGATSVTSVDTSKTSLAWSKKNFTLNGIDPAFESYKFFATDARLFLTKAKQKKERYDLIICDPPTFSRGKNNLFVFQKDFSAVLLQILDIAAPRAEIILCTNFQAWSLEYFVREVQNILGERFDYTLSPQLPDLNFTLSEDETTMKSVRVSLR
jgi:23S rRNA (cytosine1962-C5)-methyltransferase